MIISQAFAADAAHHAGPFYANPEFWVGVAFIVVVAFLARPIVRLVKNMTASRADEIRRKIDEAHSLKEEAVALLNDYKERFRNADKESEAIIEKAKISVEKYKQEAMEDINVSLAHKEENFALRVNAMERDASNEIRNTAVDFSVETVRNIIKEKMSKDVKEALFDNAVGELSAALKKSAS